MHTYNTQHPPTPAHTHTHTHSMTTAVEVGSMEMLSETSKDPSSRPISSLSEPASPITKSRVHTMPSNKRKITTFFKSGKPQSKSFSKADTLARKRKVQKSGFLAGYQDPGSGVGFGESIDLQYSEQVDLELSAVQGEGKWVWSGCNVPENFRAVVSILNRNSAHKFVYYLFFCIPHQF